MQQRIIGFHQDEEQHWVADLECGHSQHVRHDPPWQRRPWVLSEESRAKYIGVELNCVACDAIHPERPIEEHGEMVKKPTTDDPPKR